MRTVNHFRSSRIAVLATGVGLLPMLARLVAKPAQVAGVVSAASARADQVDAIVAELSAASSTPIDLVEGKAPEWITLMPAGTFKLNDGRGIFQNLDPDAVISASKMIAGSVDIPGDYDHHMDVTLANGVKGIACGWIKELKNEGGAIRAKVDWTSAGARHIADREYRYVSPRFAFDAQRNVLAITRFGLTNKPAIVDMPAIAAAQANPDPDNNEDNMKLLDRMIGALALSASATEDQVFAIFTDMVGKVNAFTKAAGVTSAAAAEDVLAALRGKTIEGYVSAADHQAVVTERDGLKKQIADGKTALLASQISAAVEEGCKAGKILPTQKQLWIDMCTSAASTDPVTNFLKTAVVIVPPSKEGQAPALAPGAGEQSAAAVEADAGMREICLQTGTSFEAFASTRNAELRARAARAAQG